MTKLQKLHSSLKSLGFSRSMLRLSNGRRRWRVGTDIQRPKDEEEKRRRKRKEQRLSRRRNRRA